MAVMTGKVYMAWQNTDYEAALPAEGYKLRSTNTVVNITDLQQAVIAAAAVAHTNSGAKWLTWSGSEFNRSECVFCIAKKRISNVTSTSNLFVYIPCCLCCSASLTQHDGRLTVIVSLQLHHGV
jgi:hypothetical protein